MKTPQAIRRMMRMAAGAVLVSCIAIAATGQERAEAPAEREEAFPALAARLEIEKQEVRVGEPLIVRLVVRNTTDLAIFAFRPSLEEGLQVNGAPAHALDWRSPDRGIGRLSSEAIRAGVVEIGPGTEQEVQRWDLLRVVVISSERRRAPSGPPAYRALSQPGTVLISYAGGTRFPPFMGDLERRAFFGPYQEAQDALPTLERMTADCQIAATERTVQLLPGGRNDAVRRAEAASYAALVSAAWDTKEHQASIYVFPPPDAEVVPGLLLLAGDARVPGHLRKTALAALGCLGLHAHEAVAPLARFARGDADPGLRGQALLALAWIEAPAKTRHWLPDHAMPAPPPLTPELAGTVQAALAAGLRDPAARVRAAALAALHVGTTLAAALEAEALGRMQDDDPAVRLNAVRLRLQRKPFDTAAADAILALLDGPDGTVRSGTLEVLNQWLWREPREGLSIDARAIEHLVPRLAALTADIASRPFREAPPVVPELLSDESGSHTNSDIAWYLLDRLRDRVPAAAALSMIKIVREAPDEKRCLRAIAFLGECGAAAAPAIPALKASLRDSSFRVRSAAAQTLSRVAPSETGAGPVLREALEDRDALAASEALQALARLRPVSEETLAYFREKLSSPVPAERSRVVYRAVALLGPEGRPLALALYRGWREEEPRSFARSDYVKAMVAVAPASEEALAMWREAIDPRLESDRALLREAVVRSRGASLLPMLRDDLARRGPKDKDDAVRLEALEALGQMPPEAASEAAAAFDEHATWLREERKRGTDRYVEANRLESARRNLRWREETRVVVPTSEKVAQAWRYTMEPPAGEWQAPGFNDSAWKEGRGGFGAAGTPGAPVGTIWKTQDLWLRREFTLPEGPLGKPLLRIHHGDVAQVWINGVSAAWFHEGAPTYDDLEMAPIARAVLKPGRNVLAVRSMRKEGVHYIDVGIVELVPKK